MRASHWRSRLPWTLFVLLVLAVATGDGIHVVHVLRSPTPAFGEWIEATVNALTFGTVGALVARHRPRNAVGWLMLGIGCASAVQLLTGEYAAYGNYVVPGRLFGSSVSAWVSAVAVVTLLGALPAMILLFPDGRLISRRWRPLMGLTISTGVLLGVGLGFKQGTFGDKGEGIQNPYGVLPDRPQHVVQIVASAGVVFCVFAAITSVVVRWRHGRPDQREQLKWVLLAGVVGPSSILLFSLLLPQLTDRVGHYLWAIGVSAIPIAAGISILRYRLYDIDRIVSRTVSYAVITGVLIAVYVGLVTAATRLTPSNRSLAVAASTLAAAALLQPLRRHVQRLVDRQFNRARYDAARTIEAFSVRLRDDVDLESLSRDLVAVVQHALEPAAIGLWLRPPE